jgi:hypothetical protein
MHYIWSDTQLIQGKYFKISQHLSTEIRENHERPQDNSYAGIFEIKVESTNTATISLVSIHRREVKKFMRQKQSPFCYIHVTQSKISVEGITASKWFLASSYALLIPHWSGQGFCLD